MGKLALEAALAGVPVITCLLLSNTPARIPLWVVETARLRRELPAAVQAVLDAHAWAGSTNSDAYHGVMTF